ncbi:NUMOD4 domain-containing protein [Bacillus cereus]|uniref:NUMOD4 domain-containing protein n=1 Tax=Bacillus cereus TaxID=1396 RepID=UPI0013D05CEA|nr:NUMOD4 domain-containing protein [Bacillus cereus]
MNEIWKDIEGYEGLYQASNLGRVKRLKSLNIKGTILKSINQNGRLLSTKADKDGFVRIKLCKEGKEKSFQLNTLLYRMFDEQEISSEIRKPKHLRTDKDKTKKVKKIQAKKEVHMLSLDGEYLRKFNTLLEACAYLIENNHTEAKHPKSMQAYMSKCMKAGLSYRGFYWKIVRRVA